MATATHGAEGRDGLFLVYGNGTAEGGSRLFCSQLRCLAREVDIAVDSVQIRQQPPPGNLGLVEDLDGRHGTAERRLLAFHHGHELRNAREDGRGRGEGAWEGGKKVRGEKERRRKSRRRDAGEGTKRKWSKTRDEDEVRYRAKMTTAESIMNGPGRAVEANVNSPRHGSGNYRTVEVAWETAWSVYALEFVSRSKMDRVVFSVPSSLKRLTHTF